MSRTDTFTYTYNIHRFSKMLMEEQVKSNRIIVTKEDLKKKKHLAEK